MRILQTACLSICRELSSHCAGALRAELICFLSPELWEKVVFNVSFLVYPARTTIDDVPQS